MISQTYANLRAELEPLPPQPSASPAPFLGAVPRRVLLHRNFADFASLGHSTSDDLSTKDRAHLKAHTTRQSL